MGLDSHRKEGERPLGFALITVSDTRRGEADTGGAYLAEATVAAGHNVVSRTWVSDDSAGILDAVRGALAVPEVDLVLCTGGTGLAPRDVTVTTLEAVFEVPVPGFGELFRMLSFEEVGPASMLSRAALGIMASTPVFALPGSPKALRLAMERLILPEAGHLVSQVQGG